VRRAIRGQKRHAVSYWAVVYQAQPGCMRTPVSAVLAASALGGGV
jgi:hypothetical protein